jgi:hypothetical protein
VCTPIIIPTRRSDDGISKLKRILVSFLFARQTVFRVLPFVLHWLQQVLPVIVSTFMRGDARISSSTPKLKRVCWHAQPKHSKSNGCQCVAVLLYCRGRPQQSSFQNTSKSLSFMLWARGKKKSATIDRSETQNIEHDVRLADASWSASSGACNCSVSNTSMRRASSYSSSDFRKKSILGSIIVSIEVLGNCALLLVVAADDDDEGEEGEDDVGMVAATSRAPSWQHWRNFASLRPTSNTCTKKSHLTASPCFGRPKMETPYLQGIGSGCRKMNKKTLADPR